ncbi:NADP-dependent 3-hydroxy acid dehydrogenase YdfG [Paenibacillus favisporus]|uniref:NADP-dependent 3-hydroxy acid dehydrogenase YdfG n=1 Tax=Paenibacillus favisporus TaxID=221028 RepID=A0ABV2F552_9BACL
MSEINGKVVVITGASSGIGEATAKLLASRGAHVVMGARRVEKLEALASLIQAEGGSALYQQLDVTSIEQMQSIIRLAQSRFGRVDVIVNNAGVMPLSPLEALKIDEWNRISTSISAEFCTVLPQVYP